MEEKITQPIEQAGMYTFYEEYDVTEGGAASLGNCIAVTKHIDTSGKYPLCVGTGVDYPDGPVNFEPVSWHYIEQFCKEVTEEQARRIHPNLFRFLDQVNTS